MTLVSLALAGCCLVPQIGAQNPPKQPARTPSEESQPPPKGQPQSSEEQELQRTINEAGNDRAALARNLEAFLRKYPESPQRAQIYRALVEATLQLRDYTRATDYAERLVALRPDDTSMSLLAIQLLDKYGDAVGWRRAISYCTRVIGQLAGISAAEKSPRISSEDWETEKKHDRASLLLVRGRLYQRLNDMPNAQKDFELSYTLEPGAAAAERLGE